MFEELGCMLFGLFPCFSCPDWLRFPFGDPGHQEEEASPEGQDEPEASASERDQDDPEAQGIFECGVFLSFRGPDSRQGLADVICSDLTAAGIRVFRDKNELQMGDEISSILPAIKNSKICVPIFSETFAASPWCLREVEAMVEHGKTIMPVFYTASPDDVKLRTELFKRDLRKHEKKHGKEQVKKWEDALKAVGKIFGREVQTTGFAEFSEVLVRALLTKLKVKKKNVTNFLVKRGDEEAAVMKLLDIGSSGIRLVGIHGMGGVGKTTLVKVLYNTLWSKFDCCSFLENVQESLRCNGLESLQRQLLGDLDPKLKKFPMADYGKVLQESFCKRKVLIVLDDINRKEQIEMVTEVMNCFGSGSRIIVTTRDKRVFSKEAHTFEVQRTNQHQALQLFSWHAFEADSPPSDYQILSNEVIHLTGQLPLALEVIGSLLHRCEKNEWEANIEKLKNIPNQDVQEKLKISFDKLEDEQKEIFLDIACFFINEETSSAIYMWDACKFFPDVGIEVLVSMSLVKITKANQFWMHDLIRDLGRELIRKESASDPSERSRVWSSKEALEVLKIKQGKEKVQGLIVKQHSGGANLTNEEFSSFRKLRLLKLVDAKLAGDFERLLPKLKWFSWHRCPSDFTVTQLSLDNLVVLNLSWSSITEKWAGWSMIQMANNLKVLNVMGCCNLTTTPDLSNNTALERLILKGCCRLADIHGSIGKLKRLKHLDLEGCYSLGGLPDEFGSLEDLEVISVEGNGNSFHLPKSIGKMRSLSILKLHRVGITRIPDSIGGLENLMRLSMRECIGLKELPDEIGDLKSLVGLDLSHTALSVLPNSIGRLVKLKSLNLESTKLGELPYAIGDLQSLVDLNLSRTKVGGLPNSVGRLAKLQYLYLEKAEVKELPDSLGDMSELRMLWLEECKIRELPSSIGKLSKLEELQVGCAGFIIEIPEEIRSLSALTSLTLSGPCITKLASTTVNEVSLLEDAAVYDQDSPLEEGSTFKGLENLGNSVGLMTPSSGLNYIPQLPSSSEELELGYITAETEISIWYCGKELVDISCGFDNLGRLFIHSHEGVLLDFPRALHLRELWVQHCNEMVEIRGLEKLESLEKLAIYECHSLETVGNLSESATLSHLHIDHCPKLREIEGIDRLVLQDIRIKNCISLRNADELKKRCRVGDFDGSRVENNIVIP